MPLSRDESGWNASFALVAFAVAVALFHHLPSFAGDTAGDWVDLFTPFAVVGAAALVLWRRVPTPALVVAIVGAILYVDGHGIHLAANSIRHEDLTGDAEDVAHFWDEDWGHIEWHLGLFVLIGAFCLAERWRPVRVDVRAGVLAALLLGWTFFTSTVEGGTWWLELAATAVFVPWAVLARRPLVATYAAAFALCALMIGVWAVWQGGVPQFSEVDLL
jgi:hypothetical protein